MSQTTRSNFWTLTLSFLFFLTVSVCKLLDMSRFDSMNFYLQHIRKNIIMFEVTTSSTRNWCFDLLYFIERPWFLLCSIAGFAGFLHIGGYCGAIWFGKHKKQHPMFSEHTQNISKFWLQWISANRATIIDLVSIRVPFGSNSYVWGRRDRTSAVGTS